MNGEIKKYQVISSGEVLKGFSILDVADSLAKLYKIPSSNAIDTLICGKPRKVRSARSKAHAESICAKLQALGLHCSVSEVRPDMPDDLSMHTHMADPSDYDYEDGDIEPLSESADEALASIDAIYKDATNKVAKSKFIKRTCFAIVLLSVIGIGSWFGLNHWLKPKSDPILGQIELAMESLSSPSVLVFADLLQARKLSRLSSLTGSSNIIDVFDLGQASNFLLPLNVLESPTFFEQSDFIAAAVFSNPKDTVRRSDEQWIMALTGSFDPDQVRTELASVFEFTKINDDLIKFTTKIKKTDVNQCRALRDVNTGSALFVSFTDDAAILSSSKELNYRFQSKLTGLQIKAPEPSSKLLSWQAHRAGGLFSMRVFDQRLVDQFPIAEQFMRSAFSGSNIDEISLRVNSDLVNQGASLALKFASDDAGVLNSAEQSLKSNIEKTKSKISEGFVTSNKFLSKLLISNEGMLALSVDLDSDLIADIKGISSDLQSVINDGALSKAVSDTALEFQALSSMWNYDSNINFADTLKNGQSSGLSPVYEHQGVSIFVDSIGVKTDNRNAIKTLQLSAARALPLPLSLEAWPQSGIQQNLVVTDALNAEGQTLLAKIKCLSTGNFSSSLQHSNDHTVLDAGFLKSTHSVDLIKGVSPDDIQLIKGFYALNVPTVVSRINVSMSSDRQASWADGRFRLSRVQGSTVQYRIFGNENSLVDIRAMNSEGQLLSRKSANNEGDISTMVFNGSVASIELFVAKEWQEKRFEFVLETLRIKESNALKKNHINRMIKAFTKSERSKFRKRAPTEPLLKALPIAGSELGRVRTKTAHLLFRLESLNNVPSKLTGEVIVPFNELLFREPNSLTIYLELNKKYKTEVSPNFSFEDTAKNSIEIGGQRYLRGNFSIKIDKKLKKINRINGKLNFELPSKLNRKVATIGASRKNDLQVLRYEYGISPSSVYAVSKEYYSAVLMAKSGLLYLAQKPSEKVLQFNTAGQAKKIELLTVSKYERFSEKFKLRINN